MKKRIIKISITIVVLNVLFLIFKNDINVFINDFNKSFYRTIIEEQRYKLIFKGLGSTIVLSLSSIIIGTIFGMIICFFRNCHIKIVVKLSEIFIRIFQGIPITVLLLTFYYVIFGSINVSPLYVAIITFSIYFSAYVAEVFRGAVNSINISQIQSAYSLGFNKIQTLKYVVLPQALTCIIPSYKNEIVSLIKLTSIAGYISIIDLTKASDIIRNRTYEAFFPLIITAIIYFVLCYVVSVFLDLIYKKINPRKYCMEVKYVRT